MASAFHDLRPEQVPNAVTQSFPKAAGQTALRSLCTEPELKSFFHPKKSTPHNSRTGYSPEIL
jgi:hypothetical protein